MFRQACYIAIVAVVIYLYFNHHLKHGYNIHHQKHYPGDCRKVSGLDHGSEHMEVTEDGLAFVTSGVNYAPMSPKFQEFYAKNNIRGRIFLYDFKKPGLGARPLKIRPSKTFDPETFRPHGIGMLEDKVKGKHQLYVVNHPVGGKDRVEKFRFVPAANELEHVRFFNDSKFLLLNDVAVIGEDQFYASNFLYFENWYLSILEHNFPLALGGLIYLDAKGADEKLNGLNSPNGLAVSKDKKFLYVAFPLEATMRVYERQPDNGLKLVQEVPQVHTLIDNLHLALSEDALLGGAHPIPHKILHHLEDPMNKSPSSVVRLPLKNGLVDVEGITELFYDHGDLISASTVAQIHSGQLLIGSIIDKLVVCDLYTRLAGQE